MDNTPEMQAVLKRNREIARQELQNVLDKIVVKETFQLTSYEKGFLKARRDYLKPEEKSKFKDILEPKEEIKIETKEETKYPIKRSVK